MNKTLVNAGSLLAVVPFAAHDVGISAHPEQAEKPDCVLMATPCHYEHAGDPHAPSPLGRLRVEITTTQTSASASTTSFGAWFDDLGPISIED